MARPGARPAASGRPRLSVALICQDEARIIGRTLAAVSFADEIVVLDSGSTDGTVEIARRFTPLVYHQPWLGYAAQKNAAIDRTTGDWILSLDADEIVEPELAAEIQAIVAGPARYVAYRIPRKLVFLGRWIRHGGWYPDYNLRLFRRGVGRFPERRVHEHLHVEGPVGTMRGALRHESHPTLEAYLDAMNRYSTLAVEEMLATGGLPRRRVSGPALLARPLGTFLYRYLLLGGFLDGRPGLILNLLHSGYVLAKYAKAYEQLVGAAAGRDEASAAALSAGALARADAGAGAGGPLPGGPAACAPAGGPVPAGEAAGGGSGGTAGAAPGGAPEAAAGSRKEGGQAAPGGGREPGLREGRDAGQPGAGAGGGRR